MKPAKKNTTAPERAAARHAREGLRRLPATASAVRSRASVEQIASPYPVNKKGSFSRYLLPGYLPIPTKTSCGTPKGWNRRWTLTLKHCDHVGCPSCCEYIVWDRSRDLIDTLQILRHRDGGSLCHLALSPPTAPDEWTLDLLRRKSKRKIQALAKKLGGLRGFAWPHLRDDGTPHMHLVVLVPQTVSKITITQESKSIWESNGWVLKHCPHYPNFPDKTVSKPWIPGGRGLSKAIRYVMQSALVGVVDADGVMRSSRSSYVRINLRGTVSKKEKTKWKQMMFAFSGRGYRP